MSIHPDDRQHVQCAIEGFLQGRHFAVEYRIKDARGKWLWFYDRSIGRREERGEVFIEGLASDITERKHAEEALRQAHQEWVDIFEAIGHPTVILDAEHTILAANHAIIETTGKSAEQLRGLKYYEVFHHPDMEGAPDGCPLHNMLASGELEIVEMEMEALGGTYLVSCTPVLAEAGHLKKIIHIATDITDRKHAEEALRQEKEKAQRYFDIAGVMLMVLNVDGTVEHINERGCEILGYSTEDVVGKNWFETFLPDSCYEQLWRGFCDFVSGKIPRQEDM
jgi:PAS domain S-box-containing protein